MTPRGPRSLPSRSASRRPWARRDRRSWVKPERHAPDARVLGEVLRPRMRPRSSTLVSRPVAMPAFSHHLSRAWRVSQVMQWPRALWVSITDGGAELSELQREIARRVTDARRRPRVASVSSAPDRSAAGGNHARPIAVECMSASRPDVVTRVAVPVATLYSEPDLIGRADLYRAGACYAFGRVAGKAGRAGRREEDQSFPSSPSRPSSPSSPLPLTWPPSFSPAICSDRSRSRC